MTAVSNPVMNSLEVLFGNELSVLESFTRNLSDLRTDILKRAYRQKMKKTHPDMAAITGIDATVLKEESQKLNEAYTILLNLVDKDRASLRMNFFHNGPVPSRRFRFGEYLFYRGAISWRTLIDSLIWQYRQRPKFGELCVLLGYITEADAARVLRSKKPSETFGETAMRLGLIDSYKRNVVLGRQKSFDTPIGKYFTCHGILTRQQVEIFLTDLHRHNLKHAGGRNRASE